MPLPGDNGKPKEERDKQSKLIEKVGKEGEVVKEVIIIKKSKKDKTIFGEI